MIRPKPVARAAWRTLWHPGTDSATLFEVPEGWRLSGHAEIHFPEGPTAVQYRIETTRAWDPISAEIVLGNRAGTRRISVRSDESGNWTLRGIRDADLHGCTDLDLAMTASTNTLAIRRLRLPVGGRREILAAWITFPDVEAHAVRQRYTRTSERHYLYEGLHNGFVAEFDVDDAGFVLDYPRYSERIRPARKPSTAKTRHGRRPSG